MIGDGDKVLAAFNRPEPDMTACFTHDVVTEPFQGLAQLLP